LEDAVKLVETRASLMESCPKGAMSAVIGMDINSLKDCCKQAEDQGVVIVANFNTKEQLVISGSPEAVSKAGSLAKEKGAKVIALPVGGAFHSPLMQSAAESFSQSLEPVVFNDAKIAVIQNCDARPSVDGKQIKEKLSKQMPSAVLWLDTIQYMLDQGVDTFIEIGPGKALAGMVKKIERSAKVLNIYDHQSLTQAISELKSLTVQA
jgi:[acyl-carrier-protein] S-malonyltransferase